jgi:hypothetical protein
MCFSSHASSGTQYQYYTNSSGNLVVGETGLPQDAIDNGYTTNTSYQDYLQQKLSDQQIASSKEIAAQQEAFNEKQLSYEQSIQAASQQQADEQSARQTSYDTGRASLLSDATNQIDTAFSKFTPDYYNQYAKDYMSQVQDQVDYQKDQATKSMMFGLARQGLTDSQALANQEGILSETAGRTLADQTQTAQQGAATLQSNVANAKQSLLSQVQSAETAAGTVAANTVGGVSDSLASQSNQISGITNSAGDVTASLSGVPTVSTLGNIFSGVLSSAGSALSGSQSGTAYSNYRSAAGLSGTSPSGKN